MKNKNKGNKHLKVLVKYLGSQNDFRQNYLPTNTVNDLKKDALKFFEINSDKNKYTLQYEDAILNGATQLSEVGFESGKDRYEIVLIATDEQDVDGDL